VTTRIGILGILLAIAALAATGCSGTTPAAVPPGPPEVTGENPGQSPSREVTVARIEPQTVRDYVEFPGQTAAVGEVEVRARVSGYVVKINFEDGQEVKRGHVLFEIDPRPYQLAVNRATSELAHSRALAEKAKADVNRAERLRPSGAVSEEEYELAVSNLKVRQAAIQTAEVVLQEAELNLEYSHVTSPIDGRVSRRRVTEGNLIHDGSGDSTVLTTVVTVDPVYVYFNIEEPTLLRYERLGWRAGDDTLFSRIKELKTSVEIGLADEEGFPHAGLLDFVDNKVDPDTGTIRARGRFDNARYLTPGMFVRVRLPIGPERQALLVEKGAIGTDQDKKFVLTVDENHIVQYRRIKVGSRHGDLWEIESVESAESPRLRSGDLVIVKDLQEVRPGSRVSLVTKATDENANKTAAQASVSLEPGKGGKSGGGAN
jgi:RND family efflux transporter MFP subunit